MRLTDADSFIAELEYLYRLRGWEKREIHFSLADIECNLDMMPTINVVLDFQAKTVRHGHWKVVDGAEPRRYGCSVCKKLSWTEDNYCPYCGARMDEVKDDTVGTV